MTMRSSIFGLVIASSIAVGLANADESNQNDARWTGFYAGAHGGLAQSDSKETLPFGAQESSPGGSKDADGSANSIEPTGKDLPHGSLATEFKSEINSKAFGSSK
jgi:hypothetical protein